LVDAPTELLSEAASEGGLLGEVHELLFERPAPLYKI